MLLLFLAFFDRRLPLAHEEEAPAIVYGQRNIGANEKRHLPRRVNALVVPLRKTPCRVVQFVLFPNHFSPRNQNAASPCFPEPQIRLKRWPPSIVGLNRLYSTLWLAMVM